MHVTTVPQTYRFFRGQLDYIRERGFEIHAVSSPGEELDELAERPGVSTHAVEMSRAITPLDDLRALAELAATIAAIEPDVVHSHTPKGGLLGMMAAALVGVDHRIYQMRGLPMLTEEGWRRQLLGITERVSCGLADRVVIVSESLRNFAVDRGLVAPEKPVVLAHGSSNGVDASGEFDPARLPAGRGREIRAKYEISEEAFVVGFVGRLVRDKGVVELVDAWEKLTREVPEARLLVVGPVDDRDAIAEETYRCMERDETIRLAGFCSDMAAHYAAMDVVAFPSHREGFPNVPLEAAAMELPVVAADAVGSVDAVEEGETGSIVPVGDARELARALLRYARDPELRRAHGEAGRERVLEKYRPEFIWQGLAELYDDVLEP